MTRQTAAIAIKDLKILLRDRGGLALLFAMPAMFILVMTLALGGLYGSGGGSLDLLVANEDSGTLGLRVTEVLKSTQGFRVETDWAAVPLTRAAAADLIASRRRNLALVIPPDFSESARQGTSGSNVGAQVELIVDPATSVQVVAPVRVALRGLIQQTVVSASLGEVRPGTPISIAETTPGGRGAPIRPNAVQQNVPAWAIFGMFFIAQTLALRFVEERELGTMRRLMAAPLAPAILLLGKLIPCLIVNLAQIALMFAVGILVVPLFGAPRLELGPHPEALVVISLAASLAATGLGLLLASVAKTPEQVGALGAFLVVTLAALGGIMVPRFLMPELMQRIALITPHAWALDGYLDVLVRGEGLGGVMNEIAVLLGFAVVFLGISIRRIRLI